MSETTVPRRLPAAMGPASLLSDERLVLRATKGDERAFAAIFGRYHQRLYRFSLAIVGNAEDAQDALQNTMVKVIGALPGERRRIELKPWLYRIAHNESIELLRRRRATEELDPEATVPVPAPGPAETAEQRTRLRRLVADIRELPDRQRGALVMRELAGLGFEQIGAALETSPAVARQTVYEARLGLRQMEQGREMSCEMVTRALSDDDGRVIRRRDLRAHLRACPGCREFRNELRARRADLAGLAPLPAAAAAGILQGLLGGGGPGGGGLAGALGGGAAKLLGSSAAVKSAATVAVVAAIGAGAAERGGLLDASLPGGGSSAPAQATSEQPGEAPAGRATSVRPAAAGGASARPGLERATGAAAGRSRLGPATATASLRPASGRTTEPASAAPETSPGASGAHRKDGGRHGAPPPAASHGQQTAASHKGARGHRGAGQTRHPEPKDGSAGTKQAGGKPEPAPAPAPVSPVQSQKPAAPPGQAGEMAGGAATGSGKATEPTVPTEMDE
jgi:RNA polymerase sigma factor (sigma-70 family)